MDNVQIAEFTLEAEKDSLDGEYVLRTGKIFEAGVYPDKKFEMTPEELSEAARDFKPVDLDLEHTPTILDGKLGKLEAVAVINDGRSLIGTARIPKWLDKIIGDGERKVSATWDRATKRLNKLALVRNPRVSDAALLSAFSANEATSNPKIEELITDVMVKWFEDEKNLADFVHKTWEGGLAIQSAHDTMSRAGAICNPPADFVSKEESKSIQKIHDMAVDGGAKCNSSGSCMYSDSDDKETKTMASTWWENLKSAFAGVPADFDPDKLSKATTEEKEDKEVKNSEEKETKEVKSEVIEEKEVKNSEPSEVEKALRAEIAKLTEEKIKRDAESFADDEIKAKRAYPAERDGIIALFVQSSNDDQVLGTKITFKKEDKEVEGTRVDALKSVFSVRKPHELTTEKLAAMGTKVLDTEDGNETDHIAEAKKQAEAYAKLKNKKAANASN